MYVYITLIFNNYSFRNIRKLFHLVLLYTFLENENASSFIIQSLIFLVSTDSMTEKLDFKLKRFRYPASPRSRLLIHPQAPLIIGPRSSCIHSQTHNLVRKRSWSGSSMLNNSSMSGIERQPCFIDSNCDFSMHSNTTMGNEMNTRNLGIGVLMNIPSSPRPLQLLNLSGTDEGFSKMRLADD